MSNVVPIGGGDQPVEIVGDGGVIDTLRRTLALAEAGEIRHIAIAYVGNDPKGMTSNKWSGKTSQLVYAVVRLLHEINLEVDKST